MILSNSIFTLSYLFVKDLTNILLLFYSNLSSYTNIFLFNIKKKRFGKFLNIEEKYIFVIMYLFFQRDRKIIYFTDIIFI